MRAVVSKPGAAILLATLLTACGPQPPEDRFRAWMATPEAASVPDYRQYLRRQALDDDVAPMRALLRSARNWRECETGEFALPPSTQWPNILPTLRVLK